MLAVLLAATLAAPALAGRRGPALLELLPPPVSPARLEGLLLARAELALAPGRPEVYPRASEFSGTTRYDELYVALSKDSGSERLARAARALSAGADAAAVRDVLERDLREGRQTPLSVFIPEPARELTGAEPGCPGPNCFNATALWHGRARELDHMLDDAAADMLFDGFRPLAAGERLAFGDVLAVHTYDPDEGDELQHTAVYVGDKFVWHKASWHASDPWTFESLADMLSAYTRPARRAPRVDLRLYRRRD